MFILLSTRSDRNRCVFARCVYIDGARHWFSQPLLTVPPILLSRQFVILKQKAQTTEGNCCLIQCIPIKGTGFSNKSFANAVMAQKVPAVCVCSGRVKRCCFFFDRTTRVFSMHISSIAWMHAHFVASSQQASYRSTV